mmetsp:Transcript_17852/g.8374  ORF Transcript_17852/g.8374 Transcript_17852/m.8374 type:complete len:85 (-) Transcript_17852:90-344(-)
MLNTTVSSKFLKLLCEKNNIVYDETLTGFKWICNKALEYSEKGYAVLFSYEEAIGYSIGMHVRDKDGVLTLGVFWELYEELCLA